MQVLLDRAASAQLSWRQFTTGALAAGLATIGAPGKAGVIQPMKVRLR